MTKQNLRCNICLLRSEKQLFILLFEGQAFLEIFLPMEEETQDLARNTSAHKIYLQKKLKEELEMLRNTCIHFLNKS